MLQPAFDVEIKEILTSLPQQVVDWGFNAIGANKALDKRYTGKGVVVGVADTGIDYKHPDLMPNVKNYKSFIDDTDGFDSGFHGTHVAGIIAGCNNGVGIVGGASDAQIVSAKIFGLDNRFTSTAEFKALYWLAEQGVDVINMSYGGLIPIDIPEAAVFAREYEGFLQELVDAGITLVAASGNSGNARDRFDRVLHPARFDCVIAVGAVGQTLQRADFSSVGDGVDFGMPGVDIYSCYPHNRWARASGTSMASPYFASCVAVLQQWSMEVLQRKLTPLEVRQYLKSFSVDLGIEGVDVEHGYGIVNIGKVGMRLLDETHVILDAPPIIFNNRTLAPLRFVIELSGGIFESFDARTRIIKFVTKDNRRVIMQINNRDVLIQKL